jgi:hypothetical protein
LSHLPHKDLLKTRQVNRLWKDVSQKHFQRRGLGRIDFDEMVDEFELGQGFDDFLENKKCQVNIWIGHHKFGNYLNSKIPSAILRVCTNIFQEKIAQFISSPATSIRSLTLRLGTQNKGTDFKFISSVLKGVPHLVELNLEIYIPKKHKAVIFEEDWWSDFAALGPLVLLKKLVLYISAGWTLKTNDRPKLKQLVRILLRLTPNLEVLDIQRGDTRQECYVIYLRQMEKMQLKWKKEKSKMLMPFENLSSLIIDWKHVELVLELSQPIKKLSIILSDFDLKPDETFLHEILNKHAKTLESLKLNYDINQGGDSDMTKIDIPKLPKLQSFDFKLYFRGYISIIIALKLFI